MPEPCKLLIGDLFQRNAQIVPNRVAAWMGGEQFTYRELNDAGDSLAEQLYGLGIRRGDRIVSWADTSLEVLPLFVALAKLGAVFAPLNATIGDEEAKPIVRMARPKMLVADSSHIGAATAVIKQLDIPLLGHIGKGACEPSIVHLDLERPPTGEETFCDPNLEETDPHVIFFTSGSTGLPKGVILSHRANYLRTFQGVFIVEPERSVCMFPLFHMAAFTLALAAWQTQGEIAFASPTADSILAAVQDRRANRLYCIPAVWNRILASATEAWDLSSLRLLDTGTSATPVELLQALKDRFPQTSLRIYYGSSEVGAGTVLLDNDVLRKPGSVGLPSPGVELKLTDAGEICLRSSFLTDGYFDAPDITNAALRDGWFHTGDLGSLDDEGYLSIVGRAKEIIRTGGESVAPTEVEAALRNCPGVEEIAIVGMPDSQWGEIICAAVICQPDSTISLSQLQQHCDGTLAKFKKPRRLELFESFPKTPSTGQVQRTLLVENILARES
ncbi:MAG: acyl--CoA ligase [Halieaceae bacterium]|jgi:fatty-acyl-CoA synthase|nr:acyl--CoA ligase [Halieaceae bacterium]